MNNVLCWSLMVLSVVVSSFSQILLKKSAEKKYHSVWKEYWNPLVICGYGMMFLATLFTVFAYKTGLDYKNGPVIESIGYVLIMFLSYLFFRERISLRKLVGNGIIILGIAVFYL